MEVGSARNKCEQVMYEALAMSAEIVLLNRILEPRDLNRRQTRTRFNINIDGVDVVRGMMEFWRRDLHLPLRILIVWRPKDNESPPWLLERWDMHFAPSEKPLTGAEEESRLVAQVKAMYKRLILLLRTLYSQSLLLPTTQVARDLDLARRKNLKTGSLRFAVCTRMHDSDAWVLLNGHDSSAYQHNPPLEFEPNNRIGELVLPRAGCAFGTFSITASFIRYIRLHTPTTMPQADSSSSTARTTSTTSSTQEQQQQHQQRTDSDAPREREEPPHANIRRNQSGLSLIFKNNADEGSVADKSSRTEEESSRSGANVEQPDTAQDDEKWRDVVADYQQQQHSSAEGGQSNWGNESDESNYEEEKNDTPPHLHHHPEFRRAQSARRASDVAWGNSDLLEDSIGTSQPGSLEREMSLPSSQSPSGERVAKMRQSATDPRSPASPLQRTAVGPRQISRSADDKNEGKFLTKRQHNRRKGRRGKREIVAPYGYAPDDEEDSPATSPIVFHKKEVVPRPIVSSRSPRQLSSNKLLPPTPDSNARPASSSEPRARATRPKTPRSRQQSPQDGGSGALVRQQQGRKVGEVAAGEFFTGRSPPSRQNSAEDGVMSKLLAGSPPSFAYGLGSGLSPNQSGGDAMLRSSVLGSSTSPTFVGSALYAKLVQHETSSSQYRQQQQQSSQTFVEEGRISPNTDAQTFFSLDGFEDDEQGGGSSRRRRRPPSALRGAPPLSLETSPFHRALPAPYDDNKDLSASPSFLERELGGLGDGEDCLPSFAFDADPHGGEDPSTTVVEAVAEMLHVSRDPPQLALDRERPLSLSQLEDELAACRQVFGVHNTSSTRPSAEERHYDQRDNSTSRNLLAETTEDPPVREEGSSFTSSVAQRQRRRQQRPRKSPFEEESGAISSSSSVTEKDLNDSGPPLPPPARESSTSEATLPESPQDEDLDDAAQPLPGREKPTMNPQSNDTSDIIM